MMWLALLLPLLKVVLAVVFYHVLGFSQSCQGILNVRRIDRLSKQHVWSQSSTVSLAAHLTPTGFGGLGMCCACARSDTHARPCLPCCTVLVQSTPWHRVSAGTSV